MESPQINNASAEKLRKQIEAQKSLIEKKDMIHGELRCSWCEKWITDEETHFYFCTEHHNLFCDRCAKNFYNREVEHKDAPKCKNKYLIGTDQNCIYEKKFTELQEANQ